MDTNDYELLRFFRKEDLIEANNAAIREGRNKTLFQEFVSRLDEDILFPIEKYSYHSDDEIRLSVVINEKGERVWLDVSELRFHCLPTARKYNDGTIEFESDEDIQSRRPYPNKREWQETVVRKPVRKQAQFRQSVLEAYGNQCAVCSVSNPKILRAAHIIPVQDGGDDSIQNGICLCVNHEIAFDAALLIITPNLEVITDSSDDLQVEVSQIRLPLKNEYYPSPDNLLKKLQILGIDSLNVSN